MGTRIVIVDGQGVRTLSLAEDLNIGNVTFIGGRGDRTWVVGQFGLGLFDGKRFRLSPAQAMATSGALAAWLKRTMATSG